MGQVVRPHPTRFDGKGVPVTYLLGVVRHATEGRTAAEGIHLDCQFD